MGEKGWVDFGTVWPGVGPAGITVVALTPAGRSVADRRDGERRKVMNDISEEPVVLTRDELVAELLRGFGWTEEQVARNPTLRAERFWFQPSKAAWYPAYDPSPTALESGVRSLRKLLRAAAARLPASLHRPGGDQATHQAGPATFSNTGHVIEPQRPTRVGGIRGAGSG